MKLLADENIPKLIVDEPRAAGHDVLWVTADFRTWDDPAILERAELETRAIITPGKLFRGFLTALTLEVRT